VGQNFNDYIKQLRIEAAKRLLQQGCYKVYEVASRSGFGDVKYFMKTFKEATGLSPGEYQKRFIS
jgi:two-component system response regulator YesN